MSGKGSSYNKEVALRRRLTRIAEACVILSGSSAHSALIYVSVLRWEGRVM